jgi:hypothetical protein
MIYQVVKATECSKSSCVYSDVRIGSLLNGASHFNDLNKAYHKAAIDNDYTDENPSACRCKVEVK